MSNVLGKLELNYPNIEKVVMVLVIVAKEPRLYFEAYLIMLVINLQLGNGLGQVDLFNKYVNFVLALKIA